MTWNCKTTFNPIFTLAGYSVWGWDREVRNRNRWRRLGGRKHFRFRYRRGEFRFRSPQITKPQGLGLFPLSQVCKFLRCASPQISTNTSQLCLKTVLKVVFLQWFCIFYFESQNYICRAKKFVFADLRNFLSPRITKKIWSASHKFA